MQEISRNHIITRAYLSQILCDVAHHGVSILLKNPPPRVSDRCFHHIPLLGRSSHRTGELLTYHRPLDTRDCILAKVASSEEQGHRDCMSMNLDEPGNKRKRTGPSPEPTATAGRGPKSPGSLKANLLAKCSSWRKELMATEADIQNSPSSLTNLPHRLGTPSGGRPSTQSDNLPSAAPQDPTPTPDISPAQPFAKTGPSLATPQPLVDFGDGAVGNFSPGVLADFMTTANMEAMGGSTDPGGQMPSLEFLDGIDLWGDLSLPVMTSDLTSQVVDQFHNNHNSSTSDSTSNSNSAHLCFDPGPRDDIDPWTLLTSGSGAVDVSWDAPVAGGG